MYHIGTLEERGNEEVQVHRVGKKFTYDVQTTFFVKSSDVHLLVCYFSHTEISAIAKSFKKRART
jgi:hypothetical protein